LPKLELAAYAAYQEKRTDTAIQAAAAKALPHVTQRHFRSRAAWTAPVYDCDSDSGKDEKDWPAADPDYQAGVPVAPAPPTAYFLSPMI
jgi:hypothetical protein